MDKIMLTKNTPLTRICGYGSLSNFLQYVIKLSLLSPKKASPAHSVEPQKHWPNSKHTHPTNDNKKSKLTCHSQSQLKASPQTPHN